MIVGAQSSTASPLEIGKDPTNKAGFRATNGLNMYSKGFRVYRRSDIVTANPGITITDDAILRDILKDFRGY